MRGCPRQEEIRVYFKDHQHQVSYLSFSNEVEAARQVRKVRDRLRRIALWDPETGSEHTDRGMELRIREAAAAE
jgi:hypothetical protein